MQKWQAMCLCNTYKKDANGMTCQYTYIIYIKILTSTILANDIICDNLYYVNIFQSTHITAYGETHMHTSP